MDSTTLRLLDDLRQAERTWRNARWWYLLASVVPIAGNIWMIWKFHDIIQLIDDAILTPRIMGSATGLSPAILLLSLSIWGAILGVLGLILAIPITCVLLAWYKRVNV